MHLKKIALYAPRFDSDGPLKFEVSHIQKRLWPYCSQTPLVTDLPMVCKSNVVPRFNSDGPLKSKVPISTPENCYILHYLVLTLIASLT